MKTVRVLHENVIMDPGGIETQLMRIYRNINREKVQFDFLVHRYQKGAYDDEILKLGGRIFYTAPFNPFLYQKYINTMRNVFDDNPDYKIFVVHSELALGALKVAKEKNIPVRICFSHNNQSRINIKRIFLEYEKLFLKKYCTDMFAVSDLAARYTFGDREVNNNNVRLIKNGILVDEFIFNYEKRISKRNELGLDDKYVIGHIGRFMEQKNHLFLLDVFKELLKINSNVHLILVGEGRLELKIKARAKELGIDRYISFLGRRMDVADLMKAMDCFVFPSFYEGFGNVIMEAQAVSLPVVMSDVITDEVVFAPHVYKLSLRETAEVWARKVNNILEKHLERTDNRELVMNPEMI